MKAMVINEGSFHALFIPEHGNLVITLSEPDLYISPVLDASQGYRGFESEMAVKEVDVPDSLVSGALGLVLAKEQFRQHAAEVHKLLGVKFDL